MDTEVLVVGAGPTGLTMAIELKRLGIPVRLIDKSQQAAQFSQALVVQARTLEQWARYGIADRALQRGRRLRTAQIKSDGHTIASFSFNGIPGNYPCVLFLPQRETERLLTEYLRELGGGIERGCELLAVSQSGEEVRSELLHRDGRIEEARSRWVVGCDGAHSAVRKSLGIGFPGDSVPMHLVLGDFELDGPGPGDELEILLHGGEVVVVGRLSESLYRVMVAQHKDEPPQSGEEPELTPGYFQAAIDRAGGNLHVRHADWTSTFRINQRKVEHYRKGNVFLAGDAAHIHSPVAGQGMNTGIQDAANLGWKLAAVAAGAGDLLLDSYDEERGAVGDALLRVTARGLAAATTTNSLVQKIRDMVLPFATDIPAIQRVVAGFISETAIGYRQSSIVYDCGGRGSLRAGDRMPNLRLGGGDVLDYLRNGRAIAVSVDLSQADNARLRQIMPQTSLIELGKELSEDNKEILGDRILVVRPDGYVGFRGGPDDLDRLDGYARRTGLQVRPGESRKAA